MKYQKVKLKILFLTKYDTLGASSRIRSIQYVPYLKNQGIYVDIAPLFDDVYLYNLYYSNRRSLKYIVNRYFKRMCIITKSKRYHLLWIEKELFPFAPPYIEQILRIFKVPYIVDYDDAIFHNYDMSNNVLVRIFLRNKIDIVMRNSAVVVAGNEYLAKRARFAGAKRIEIMPTVVDLNRYKFSNKFNKETFTIGWIGSPATSKYLEIVRNPLRRFFSRYNNVKLVLVGSGNVNFHEIPTEIMEWKEKREVSEIQQFDVGIMPLFDGPWERGKCGYKLIQYMACGKPVIASPVGANRKIVINGVNGFLANSDTEWYHALVKLYGNIQLRKKMGMKGRKIVEEHYSLSVTIPKLVEIIRSVAKV